MKNLNLQKSNYQYFPLECKAAKVENTSAERQNCADVKLKETPSFPLYWRQTDKFMDFAVKSNIFTHDDESR